MYEGCHGARPGIAWPTLLLYLNVEFPRGWAEPVMNDSIDGKGHELDYKDDELGLICSRMDGLGKSGAIGCHGNRMAGRMEN
jgi:hypothetical protein